MHIAPARLDEILTELFPAGLEGLHVGIPLNRLTIRPKNAELVTFVAQACPHFARQILSTSMEQPDHDCHLPAQV